MNNTPSDKQLLLETLRASYQARSLLLDSLFHSHLHLMKSRSPLEKHKHDPYGYKKLKFDRIYSRVRKLEAEILELFEILKLKIQLGDDKNRL
jgi:hypothetical protein